MNDTMVKFAGGEASCFSIGGSDLARTLAMAIMGNDQQLNVEQAQSVGSQAISAVANLNLGGRSL